MNKNIKQPSARLGTQLSSQLGSQLGSRLGSQLQLDPQVPCFAVIGRVNTGKSSVLATLLEQDDNSIIPISDTPGETTHTQLFKLEIQGENLIQFYDTPGFQQPSQAKQAILELHRKIELGTSEKSTESVSTETPLEQDTVEVGIPSLQTMKLFVSSYQAEFPDECELLAPLLEGAGAIYIVNPDLACRKDFYDEIELIRWTRCPRMALINQRSRFSSPNVSETIESEHEPTAGRYETAWKELLDSHFNLRRTFDAHQANFMARKELIRALMSIDENNQNLLTRTVEQLDAQWKQRRELAAHAILICLSQVLLHEEKGLYEKDKTGGGTALNHEEAKAQLLQKLVNKQSDFTQAQLAKTIKTLLNLYQYQKVAVDKTESILQHLTRQTEWRSEDTWERFGLTQSQLIKTAAGVGAGAGLAVDVGLGLSSFGLGALVGGIGGAFSASKYGDALPNLKFSRLTGLKKEKSHQLVVGAPKDPNFEWVLLDFLLIAFKQLLQITHGNRLVRVLKLSEQVGYSRQFSAERRKQIGAYFLACRKNKQITETVDTAIEQLLSVLEEIEAEI